METLDEAIARRGTIKRVIAEPCCLDCGATLGMHEFDCPSLKRKPKKEEPK